MIAILAVFCSIYSISASAQDTVLFSQHDPAMNAAIEKARASLPAFWEKFGSPGPGEEGFSLKVAISDGDATEHFWCGSIEGNAEKSSCAIANEPLHVRSVKYLQRVDVDPNRISDWMYRLKGKIKGGETIRAIIPMLSQKDAEYYRSLLADP
ncbi:MAG: YegJ family protein [Aestuariivirga sp.]